MACSVSANSAPAGYSRSNDVFFINHFTILDGTQDKFRLKLCSMWFESVPNSSCYVLRCWLLVFIQRYKINSLTVRTLQRKLIKFDAQYL